MDAVPFIRGPSKINFGFMLSTAWVDFSLFDTLGKILSNQSMRILASADLHGDFEAYQWLVESVRRHETDAVVSTLLKPAVVRERSPTTPQ